MEYTTINNLRKPELTDPALIADINYNSDIIDAAIAKSNFHALSSPTVNDDGLDGYSSGSIWIDWTSNKIFILKNNATGAAVWWQIWPALAADINASAPFLIPQATNSNGTIRYIGLGNYLRLGSMAKGAYSYISHNAILTTSSDTLGNKFSPQYSPGQGIIQLGGFNGNLSFYGIDWNSSAEDKIFPNDFTLILTLLYNGNVGIKKSPNEALDVSGNINATGNIICYDVYAYNNISALTFTDRTKGFTGDAISEIAKIKNDKNGNIDHSTIPEFAQVKKSINEKDNSVVIERDLGSMISILTVAVQQLIEQNTNLATRITQLENIAKNNKNKEV